MRITRNRVSLDRSPLKALVSVHGNAAEPEYPSRIEEVSRKGWGATFWGRESTTNWFHVPFSAPNVLENSQPRLSRIFLFYHNTTRSPISAVHLYDGSRLLKAFDGLELSGEHAAKPDKFNTFLLDKPTALKYGLGVSVNVDFPADSGERPPRWILFTAVTAEFRG